MAQALRLIASVLLLAACAKTHAAEITESATNDGVVIAIRGDLEAGDDRKFDQVAQRYSKGAVYLESRGGDLVTGIAIGESIRLKGFLTFLPPNTTCASSCALAWLGGSRRFLSPTSRLGFHAAYRMDGTAARETGIGNAVVGAYLTRIGLPISAVIYITKASPDAITWLTPADAQKVGIEFSFIEDVFPNKSANQPTPQSQPPVRSQPSSEPTPRQEVATPPSPPRQSIIREQFYVAVDDKVVELRNLRDRCAHIIENYVPFIGKVVQTNFAKNGVVVESFVLEKLDRTKEVIYVANIDYMSRADAGWVVPGLQTMLRKDQEVSGEATLCSEGQRVLYQLKRQGPTSNLLPSQTSKLPKESQPAQKQENLAAPSVTTKEPVLIARHYKTSGGKVIELFKLSTDCDSHAGFYSLSGKVAQTDFGNDGVTIAGFVLEKPDGSREYINVETLSDISISEVKFIMQALHSILRQGQAVTGEMRPCGAAGRVMILESVKSDSTSIRGARKADH
jgi:ATP-dependent protease ClpP protease subunit